MAQKDTGEDRVILPDAARMRRLRRDGSVPRSRDLQTAATVLAVLIYLMFAGRSILARMEAAFRLVDVSMPGGFAAEAQVVVSAVTRLAVEIVGPIILVALVGGLAGAIFDARGMPLALKTLIPDPGRLSPAEGFKRMFSNPSLSTLGKGVAAILAVFGANVLLFRAYYNDLMWAPSCGTACVARAGAYLLGGSIAIGVAVMIVLVIVDYPLSRWLFALDNRMSVQEDKRARKDEDIDPQVRKIIRQQMREAAQLGAYAGFARANLVLCSGDAAVAIAYVFGETPAPVVSARTMTEADTFSRKAREIGIPVYEEPVLTLDILSGGEIGRAVPQSTFMEIARVLILSGLLPRPKA